MGTEPAPSPPASCQSPPRLHGFLGREEGLCQQSEGLKGEKQEGVLPQGLGTPRCCGAPTGAQCCGNQEVDGPCSRGARTPRAWLGATHPGLLLRLPQPVPNKLPAALANGARCCFGENTFWSLLSGPSQPTPTVEKMCQDKWKISHKYLEKGKREKERRTNCLGALCGHLGDGHGQMRMAGHRHLSPCRRPQWEPPGPGPVRAVGTEGPWLWGEARPAWVASGSHGAHVVPGCRFPIVHNRVSELSCLGTSLQVERRLKWLQGRSWEESGGAPGAETLRMELVLEQRVGSTAELAWGQAPLPGRLSRGARVGSVLRRPGLPSDGPFPGLETPLGLTLAQPRFQPHRPMRPWKQNLLLRSSCPWAPHMPFCCPLAASLTRCRGLAPFVSDHRGWTLHTGGKDGPRGRPPGWAGSPEDKMLGERSWEWVGS